MLPLQIEARLGVYVVQQRVPYAVSGLGLDHYILVAGVDEAGRDGFLDPGDEAVPVAVDVEHDDALAVDAELVPGGDLHELLEGAVAAAEGDEAAAGAAGVDLLGHHVLARVHVLDDGGLAVLVVLDALAALLELDEGLRDDAVDGVGAGEGDEGLGHLAHHAVGAAAVDEVGVVLVQDAGELAGGLEMCRRFTRGGAAAGQGKDGC
jgi:hypothetical protein